MPENQTNNVKELVYIVYGFICKCYMVTATVMGFGDL